MMSNPYDIQPGDSDDIKIAKLAAIEKRDIRNADMFKWFVISVLLPACTAIPAFINNRAIAGASQDAKVAATRASAADARTAIVEEKVTKELLPASLSSNAIDTEWKAGRTGDPEDKAKAETAAAKVMLQERPAAKAEP